VSFRIPRAVLTLPVRLIDRWTIDERTSRTGALVVRIHIIHMDDETRIGDINGPRGVESMFRRDAMQPNRGVTRTDLGMNRLTFCISIHAPSSEAERMDEKIVSLRNVLVRQNRDDSLELGHDVLLAEPGRAESGGVLLR
jgi:hypothetical protein